jgi:hypothetical protein
MDFRQAGERSGLMTGQEVFGDGAIRRHDLIVVPGE